MQALRALTILLCVSLSTVGVGCSSGGGGGTGTLNLEATDAPISPELVESATIHVTRIRLHASGSGDEDGGFITAFDDPTDPIVLELTDLRNGLTEELATIDLPAGTYRQIRLYFGFAELVIDDGIDDGLDGKRTYNTDGPADPVRELRLTSQATGGLKLFPSPPIEIVAGFPTDVLLDFELSKTFRPLPATDPPQDATAYQLGPVIRVANLGMTGEVRGVVAPVDGETDPVVVYLLPAGETDLENSVASTIAEDGEADEAGRYAFIGVEPGTYDVFAKQGAADATVPGVVVAAGQTTEVEDIDLSP